MVYLNLLGFVGYAATQKVGAREIACGLDRMFVSATLNSPLSQTLALIWNLILQASFEVIEPLWDGAFG